MKHIACLLLAALTVTAAVPVNQETYKNGVTIRTLLVEQSPLSDPEYTGGSGVFVRVLSAHLNVESVQVSISVKLRTGQIVTSSQSGKHKLLMWNVFYFNVGSVESIEAVAISERPPAETINF